MKVLSDVRVVEIGAFISGPFATMLLGDFGADVIKVEQPGTGDPFRAFQGGLYSPQYQSFNRNKRSIALDLGNDDDRRTFDELIRTADVFVQNFRPAYADKRGFGIDRLRSLNPNLIYCSVSGFGASGPYADRPAYDTVAQAMSGFLLQMLNPKEPRIAGPAIADAVTGLYAAYGILGALHERTRTRAAPTVDISMLEAMTGFFNDGFVNYYATGKTSGPYVRASVSQSYVYRCADGKLLALHLSSPEKFWSGLVTALGQPELLNDPRYASRGSRVKNYEAMIDDLRPVFLTRSRADWMTALEANDVPFAPVYDVPEVLEDPQFAAMSLEVTAFHPTEGNVRSIRTPVRFDGEPDLIVLPPPTLDEQRAEILREVAVLRSTP